MEEWKNIEGYNGVYQVSNTGNVRRVKQCISNQFIETKYVDIEPVMLKQYDNNKGYYRVVLNLFCKKKMVYVHRLVASAFLPNPLNLPEVNHKDENGHNNNVSNLEWCTHQYNSSYGTRGKRIGEKNRNGKGAKRPVLQYDKYGTFINRWKSMQEVHDVLGLSVAHICQCCRGQRNSCGGFMWRYEFPNERDR